MENVNISSMASSKRHCCKTWDRSALYALSLWLLPGDLWLKKKYNMTGFGILSIVEAAWISSTADAANIVFPQPGFPRYCQRGILCEKNRSLP